MLTCSMYIGLVEERKKERKKESARDSVSAGFDHSPTTLAVSRFCLGEKHLGLAREGVCLVKFSISRDLPVKWRRFLNAL